LPLKGSAEIVLISATSTYAVTCHVSLDATQVKRFADGHTVERKNMVDGLL